MVLPQAADFTNFLLQRLKNQGYFSLKGHCQLVSPHLLLHLKKAFKYYIGEVFLVKDFINLLNTIHTIGRLTVQSHFTYSPANTMMFFNEDVQGQSKNHFEYCPCNNPSKGISTSLHSFQMCLLPHFYVCLFVCFLQQCLAPLLEFLFLFLLWKQNTMEFFFPSFVFLPSQGLTSFRVSEHLFN